MVAIMSLQPDRTSSGKRYRAESVSFTREQPAVRGLLNQGQNILHIPLLSVKKVTDVL
jgi:hypothetical protein